MEADLGRELLLARPLLPSLGIASVLLLIACLLLIALRGARKGTVDDAAGGQDELDGDLAEPKTRVTILFGTQTGTAERFAKQVRTELLQRYGDGMDFAIEDMETYAHEARLPGEHLVLFLLATYGDGEPTDNALEFYNWVTAAAKGAGDGTGDEALLKDVSFGVFGLGNKQYEHFAAVGKVVHDALLALGASAIVRRGDGDDDADIDEDFELWRADLIKALDDSPLVAVKTVELDGPASVLLPSAVPAYTVSILTGAEAAEAKRLLPGEGRGTGVGAGSPFMARVLDARELHGPGSDRSCLHVELDITGSQITYEAGDHVAVYAENSPATVTAAAACLGVPLDTVFTLDLPQGDTQQLSPPFLGPISLRRALALHADVLAPAHRETLEALAAFAGDASEAARLRHLASPEGKAEYQAWVAAPSRSVLEVLQAFPSTRPTLGAFFGSIAPRLQPRFYSISSAPAAHPGAVHITCAVVHDTTPSGRTHEGIASFFLKRAAVGASVPVYVRHSSFRLPPTTDTPVIMVGPGTGLAPFRGFLQRRAALKADGAQLGPALLYFGCRRREHDYIYQRELEAFAEAGVVSRLSVAFSRENAQKDYVQHHLERDAEEVWALLERGGHVYVCGDAKHMARDVHRALIELIQRQAGCSGTQAETRLKQLADTGRYQRDVW